MNSKKSFLNYLANKSANAKTPFYGTFELTPVCNLNCKMCYVRMSKMQQEAMGSLRTADEWISLAKEAADQGMLRLLITGGEPFLRPDIQFILESLNSLGLVLSVNTNGTMIDENAVNWISKIKPLKLNITLYGASEDTYRELCGDGNAYNRVIKAIEMLLENNVEVKLSCSLTPHNADDLQKIVQFAHDHKLVLETATYMFPPVRKAGFVAGKNDRFTPEEAEYFRIKYNFLYRGRETYTPKLREQYSQLQKAVPAAENDRNKFREFGSIHCHAGKSSFWITWKGNMNICGMIPEADNNAFEKGFSNAWKACIKTADQIRLAPECEDCEFKKHCSPCAAIAYAETGSFSEVPVYKCKMCKSYKKTVEDVYSELTGDVWSCDQSQG